MKKLILFAILISVSCSTEQNESETTEINEFTTIAYQFDGETLEVEYTVDLENDELIPIESDAYNTVENIFEQNENLIQYEINENQVLLFSNDKQMMSHLEKIGRPLRNSISQKSVKNISSVSHDNSSFLFQPQNLELYYDCCYDARFEVAWWTSSNGSAENSNCQVPGSNEARLKDFTNTALWTPNTNVGVGGCVFLNPFPNPDNRLNSVLVRNVFARFYENPNHSGRSIVRDARFGSKLSGFRKLRRVRHRGRWNNRISSIKLSF